METQLDDEGNRVGRVIAGVVSAILAIPFLLNAFSAVASRLEISFDPHGYRLIFGTFLALISGLVLSIILPLAFPRSMRSRTFAWSLGCYGFVVATLIVLFITA